MGIVGIACGLSSYALSPDLTWQVVVHNLPWSCTWQQLKDHFGDFNVERAELVLDSNNRSR